MPIQEVLHRKAFGSVNALPFKQDVAGSSPASRISGGAWTIRRKPRMEAIGAQVHRIAAETFLFALPQVCVQLDEDLGRQVA